MYNLVQGGSTSGVDDNDIDWNTEDELEFENFTLSPSSSVILPGGEANVVFGEPGEVNDFASACSKINFLFYYCYALKLAYFYDSAKNLTWRSDSMHVGRR